MIYSNVPFVDVAFENIPEEIIWLHYQASQGVADKYQNKEAAFVVTQGDKLIYPKMKDYVAVILGYKGNAVEVL